MSQKALSRDEVIRDFHAGRLSREEAASVLKVSERTVSRLMSRWKKRGLLGLEHGLIGRVPPNRLSEDQRDRILDLLKGPYFGFNLKHFHEMLIEKEKLEIASYSSIKRLAKSAQITRAKKRRGGKVRKRRERFACAGYLLQMDGSSHRWWKGQESCLIAGIDDATSEVAYGEFFETETLEGYMRVLRGIIERKGIPRLVYVDRASWLGGLSQEEKSQFQRMCEELGIRVLFAGSAEAKGRIERLWGTLQDRLVSEFRMAGVSSIESANEYLNQKFLKATWNKKFTHLPENQRILYRPVPRKSELDQIFCLKFERKIRRDHTVLWENELYEIMAELPQPIHRYQAQIRIYPDGTLKGYFGGKELELRRARSRAWRREENPKSRIRPATWFRVRERNSSIHKTS